MVVKRNGNSLFAGCRVTDSTVQQRTVQRASDGGSMPFDDLFYMIHTMRSGRHHPDGVLFRITKEGPAAVVRGGYQSDMPGFENIMSDDEILAVLTFIKGTWPERERRYQEEISRRERAATLGG